VSLPNLPSWVSEVGKCLTREENRGSGRSGRALSSANRAPGDDRLRTALARLINEIRWAWREAQAEVEWHQRALNSAKARAEQLERRLASYDHLIPAAGDRRASAKRVVHGPPAAPDALEPRQPERASLAIFTLGPFRVVRSGQVIDEWHGTRSQVILKYLVSQGPKPVARDFLMSTFWPEADDESARRNLHQAIYNLRQALRFEAEAVRPILLERGHYRLNVGASIWIDLQEFQARLRSARALARAGTTDRAAREWSAALELYQGDFLAEDVDDHWILPPREAFRRDFIEAADQLSAYLVEHDDQAAAERICQRIIELDRCHEQAHRRLMRCYLRRGERVLAIRQYHTCLEALRTEADVAPTRETQSLFDSIVREDRREPPRPATALIPRLSES